MKKILYLLLLFSTPSSASVIINPTRISSSTLPGGSSYYWNIPTTGTFSGDRGVTGTTSTFNSGIFSSGPNDYVLKVVQSGFSASADGLRVQTASDGGNSILSLYGNSGSFLVFDVTDDPLITFGASLVFGADGVYSFGTSSSRPSNIYIAGKTIGGIFFPNSDGLVTQDASNLYWDNNTKRMGIGLSNPNATLELRAGVAGASGAPLKFRSGTLMTTAEAGAIEFLTDKLYGTITTGAARKEITLNDAVLTSGRVPIVTTNGRLTDDAGMTYSATNDTLTLAVSNLSVVSLSSGIAYVANTSSQIASQSLSATNGQVLVTSQTASSGFGWSSNPYLLTIGHNSYTSNDAETRYSGSDLTALPLTTESVSQVYIPKDGTVTKIVIHLRISATLGSNEAVSVYFRKNATTDTTLSTTETYDSAYRVLAYTGLSIPVVAGDTFQIKTVAPTWATNPTGIRYTGYVYIE